MLANDHAGRRRIQRQYPMWAFESLSAKIWDGMGTRSTRILQSSLGIDSAKSCSYRLVTGKRPKDLHSMDRSDLGGDTWGGSAWTSPAIWARHRRRSSFMFMPRRSFSGSRSSLLRSWIEIGNLRRHKQLGRWTVGVSALLVPLGLAAALVDQARQVTHADYAPQFLARNPAAHKRLMILSAVAISDAGFARIWLMGIKTAIPGLFGWWLQFFWGIFLILVATGVWDLWHRRRIPSKSDHIDRARVHVRRELTCF